MNVLNAYALVIVLIATVGLTTQPCRADTESRSAVKIRLGTLAPRGTSWHRELLKMGAAWRTVEGPRAEFIIYSGGSQGSEADMVRRMRVGQLNAALLSVIGLTQIDESVAALQKMPMVFRSWDELDYVRDELRPVLDRRLLERGFVVLTWGDAGWVRFFSKESGLRPADYRKMKTFAWAGDTPQVDIMTKLGYRPVVLELSNILPGLQSGMIDMVPSTPFWALTLQFYGHTPHMLEMNWAPMVGALVVTRKVWDSLSPPGREALRAAGETTGVALRAISRREQEESVKAMEKRGLHVNKLTPELEAEWREVAERLYPMIRGQTVPAPFFDQVQRLVRAYRNKPRNSPE